MDWSPTRPGHPITIAVDPSPNRRSEILRAAAHMFAAQGVKGASLRHIARDAGVSLTLLSHHFGNKAQLLDAVIASHHAASLLRVAGLKTLLRTDRTMSLERLVDAWVEYEFELHGSRNGRQDLRLIVKLADDPDIDAGARQNLDHAGPVIVQGLNSLRPGLSEATLSGAWSLASAALYAAVWTSEAAAATPSVGVRKATSRFLHGGLSAYIEAEIALA